MTLNSLYYALRPYIPRSVQIAIRRAIVKRKLPLYADVWPIDPKAATPPPDWKGWPDGKKFAFVITHDVETKKGVDRVLQLAAIDAEYGFRSSFNFVAEDYEIPEGLRERLVCDGFEVGLHGLTHRGNPYESRERFERSARRINQCLKEWRVSGFRTPSMYHNLDWISALDVAYDCSTFDTDPFEPQPDGIGTIFPKWISANGTGKGYLELPYTLPQDFLLFVVMKEKGIDIWKKKLDWIAMHGGMALCLTHPDYASFDQSTSDFGFPVEYYRQFLEYVRDRYDGQYWHAVPRDVAQYCTNGIRGKTVSPMSISTRSGHGDRKIWIDLDNSPHVPFFDPIMKELRKQDYEVVLTARDCSQTCGLADLFEMKYRRIGRHFGKKTALKVAGTILRAAQLSAIVGTNRPSLAVSHGSRAQMMSALMLHVPSVAIMDYEHVKGFIRPTWIMMPEVIKGDSLRFAENRIIRYPGIKEDVYVPSFRPDPGILDALRIERDELIVTVRPPATEAHYHNPEAEALFIEAVNRIGVLPNSRMVILPRNDAQKVTITNVWSRWCSERKIIIPEQVVDGLNLLWHSDLAISGGGTMNREAAALGVPVYSIFRGKTGDVDRYLVHMGRLVMLESIQDVDTKLSLRKRTRQPHIVSQESPALKAVVDGIMTAAECG